MNKLPSRQDGLKYITKFLTTLLLFGLIAGCAKPQPPKFYPAGTETPRIQLLAVYSNQKSMKTNDFTNWLLGDDSAYRLQRAYGVTFHKNQLFVVDAHKKVNGYAVFDLGSKKLDVVTGAFKKPIDIAVSEDGTRYVSDTGHDAVLVLNSDDKVIRTIKTKGTFRPTGLEIRGDKLFVADIDKGLIRIFDRNSGALIASYGEGDKLWWPTGIALDAQDNIFVVETGRAQVAKFAPNGDYLERYGELGDRFGNFIRPKDIAIDRDGRFYVVDAAIQEVQIFNKEGKLLLSFGGVTPGPEAMILPAGITISYEAVPYFRELIAPDFDAEYIIAVTSQGSPNRGAKVAIYALGKRQGVDYGTTPD